MHLDGHSWAPTPVIPHRCWLDTFVGCVWDVRDLNLRGFAECSSCCNHVITHDELVCLFLIDVLSGLSNNRFSGSLPSALPQFVISLWDLALSSWNFSDYLYNFTAHSETTWYQEPLSIMHPALQKAAHSCLCNNSAMSLCWAYTVQGYFWEQVVWDSA